MRVTIPPSQGVQVGRAFAIRVDFFRPGTAEPFAVPASESIAVSLAAGVGTLSGTVQLAGDGTATLVFDRLSIDREGDVRLEVRASTPDVPAVVSDPFSVGRAFEFEFVDPREIVYAGVPYDLCVRVVDADTGQAAVPDYSIEVTLQSDTGALRIAAVDASGEVRFTGLVEAAGVSTTGWTVSAFGFPAAAAGSVPVEVLTVAGLSITGSELVGGDVTLSGTIVGTASGLPAADLPDIVVEVAAAGAVLTGTTSDASNGNAFSIGPMQFGTAGDFVLEVDGPHFVAPVGIVTRASYALAGTTDGPTTALPNEPLGPFTFALVDAGGNPFNGSADPVLWTVTRADDTVVASGTAIFENGIATVEPGVAEGGTFTFAVRPGAVPTAVDEFEETVTVDFETVDGRGPFVALKSVRVGSDYADSVAFAALPGTVAAAPAYGVLTGALPDGIVLDQATGALGGAPTTPGDYEFTLWARQSDTRLQPLRCALAVFAADESDVALTPPDLAAPGPFAGQATSFDQAVSFLSSFDGVAYSTAYRAWVPPLAARPAPVLVWHHGRTVGFENYDDLGRHLAEWGIAFVSVEDDVSFRAATGVPDTTYDQIVIEAGIESGAAFLEAVADDLDARTANAGDPLEGMFDIDALFFGGHERGGGSAQAAHARWRTNQARGYVYASALDLRFSTFTIPPGDPRGTAMYPVETDLPRVPSLVFSAELDFDMFYPVPDQFSDRRTGPNTFVTIYGGVGSFVTDTATYDAAAATITRAEQHRHLFRYITAFVKRWTGDRSLDGLLYGRVDAGSEQVGVFGWRNMVERILVDDFQDADPATNALGLANSLTAASRNEQSIYPTLGGFPSLGIRHNVVFLSGTTDADYVTELGGLDVTARRRLAFRIGQTTDNGFDWITVRVRLVDGFGASAAATVWDSMAQAGDLPDYDIGSSLNTYERFVGVEVPLTAFAGVDLTDVVRLDLVFETDGTFDVSRRVYFDDLRFE